MVVSGIEQYMGLFLSVLITITCTVVGRFQLGIVYDEVKQAWRRLVHLDFDWNAAPVVVVRLGVGATKARRAFVVASVLCCNVS